MNPAAAIALVAATLNLSAAVMLTVISRAPGWRAARTFAAIALTAGLYSCCSYVFCLDGLAPATYLVIARFTYLAGHVSTLVWFALAFGGPEASWRAMPRSVRWYSGVSLSLALLLFLTGLHLQPRIDVVNVAWAGVRYHYPVTTRFGDWYGLLILLQFAVTFVQLLRRVLQGERGERLQVLAFGVFFSASVVELLVANRVIEFLSPSDLGMLVVVLPVSVRVVRRFVADAERLNDRSGQLAGEVREQSEWRDRAQVAFVESERMAALGRMAAGVGHEINNPLTYLTLSLGEIDTHLIQTDAPADVMAALGHARDGATRIQRVAERLRSYSRRHDERVPVDLRDVVAAAVKVAGASLDPSITVSFVLDPAPRVLGDEPRLVQAAVSVLTNAAQAVNARPGARNIRVITTTNPSGQSVLSVEDDGVGVRPEHLARLGEPYFTTRAKSGALGLGLFVTRGIVDAHGGRTDIQPNPGAGTTVRLVFPGLRETPTPLTAAPVTRAAGPVDVQPPRGVVSDPEALPRPATVLPFPPPLTEGDRPTVLIIDDEPLVAKLLETILQRNWDVTAVSSGAEALHHLSARRFDAIICDVMMPGMSGIELAEVVRRQHPQQRDRMLFLTGGAVTIEAEDFLERADVRHLTKPVTRADLQAALTELRTRTSGGGAGPQPPIPIS